MTLCNAILRSYSCGQSAHDGCLSTPTTAAATRLPTLLPFFSLISKAFGCDVFGRDYVVFITCGGTICAIGPHDPVTRQLRLCLK